MISENEGCDGEGASDNDTAKSDHSWDRVDPHYNMFDEESEEEEQPEEEEKKLEEEDEVGEDIEVIEQRVWRHLELWRSEARRRAKGGSRFSCSPRRLQQLPSCACPQSAYSIEG